MKNKIVIGMLAMVCAAIFVCSNGLAMQGEMVKVNTISTINLDYVFDYYEDAYDIGNGSQAYYSENLGAVSDFNSENGTHDSMLLITYSNDQLEGNHDFTYSTFNETGGVIVQAHDTIEHSQICLFEPYNNSAVLNGTMYWTYADTSGFGAICSKDNPVKESPEPMPAKARIGYYVNSTDYDENIIISENINTNVLDFSVIVYQGFLVWSYNGYIVYYTGLPDSPVEHILKTDIEGCQRNCIYNNSLWFGSDDHLYQMTGSILDPEWLTYYPEKPVTALDVYIDQNGVSHLIICYSHDDAVYEFDGKMQHIDQYSEYRSLFIDTIYSTRNYNGGFYVSGKTQDDIAFIARMETQTRTGSPLLAMMASDTIFVYYEEVTVMCNLTSDEQLYLFVNSYYLNDFLCYHYAGETPTPSVGAGITITLTRAGHWTTGKDIEFMFEYVGTPIIVEARVQCDDGIYGVNFDEAHSYFHIHMDRISGNSYDGIYNVVVPAQTTESTLSFYISARSVLSTDIWHPTPKYNLYILDVDLAHQKSTFPSIWYLVVPIGGMIAVVAVIQYIRIWR